MTTPKKSPSFNFESALAELSQLVDAMENNQLDLEDSLKKFERGIELTRLCQQALQAAEQKVQILLEKEGKPVLEDFHGE